MAGRPREFDIEDALHKAMEVFWQKGYEATSMADLIEVMGLHKGSIYKAFKDKYTLFVAALSRYLEELYTLHRDHLTQEGFPESVLSNWLLAVVKHFASQPQKRGCFAVNTLVELAPHDKQIASLVGRNGASIHKHLTELIGRGQKDGCFRSDLSTENLAGLVMYSMTGFLASIRGGAQRQGGLAMVESVMAVLKAQSL